MNQLLQSSRLHRFSRIEHGFSTKETTKPIHAVFLNQLHSDQILYCDSSTNSFAGDGIVTCEKNIKIGVKTADCVPILLFEHKKGIIGAVHAGWKGTSKRIVQKMISKIIILGGKPENIFICMGPAIDWCCYDIPKDRSRHFNPNSIKRRNGKLYLNLRKDNVSQLLTFGIPENNIDCLAFCTSCNNDMFYSYRKEAPLVKQNISYIKLH